MTSQRFSDDQLLHCVLANAAQAILALDPGGRLLFANRAASEMTGLSPDELIGSQFSALVAPESRAAFAAQFDAAARRGGTASHHETELLGKNGSTTSISLSLSPVQGGGSVAVVATAEDISERKLEEDILKISMRELEFQKIALDRHAIMSVADASGRIVSVNDKFIEISQYSAEELLGQDHRMLNSGLHPKAFFAEMWATIARGEVWEGEIRNRKKDGSFYWVESTIVPFLDDGGKPYKYVALRTEITRTKQAEEALKAVNDELEHRVEERTAELKETNRRLEDTHNQLLQSEKMASIGQLAAGVAHEINNPIGYVHSNMGTLEKYLQELFAVLAAYEGVERDLAGNAALSPILELRKTVDVAFLKEDLPALIRESQDGISRVKKIVHDLKNFSHIDTSDDWGYADLNLGLESTLGIAWNELKYKAEVVKEYAELPEVECMHSQINQVFLNLLVNAAHAIEERGTITIRTGAADGQVWVEIADTGKGIAPEHMKRIFDPFFTTKPVGKGTGLGLSLSYGIVQKHGGSIEVQSKPGEGTRFRVVLPVQRQEPK